MNLTEIANQIQKLGENLLLIYAFNAVGKTRLSVAFKDVTKNSNSGQHAGVYYNAFSEDLFAWDNDIHNNEQNIRLKIEQCSLNQFHGLLNEEAIRDKLTPYMPNYDFSLTAHDDEVQGIESISFYQKGDQGTPIKISRGEERVFVWCFFLALFEIGGWADQQGTHFFIDDPVSSLDEHYVFVTADTICELIDKHYLKGKVIITTHHIGLFSILADRLQKGEKSNRYRNLTKSLVLNRRGNQLFLDDRKNSVVLFHLHLLYTLDRAINERLYNYHFALLRQLLENISAFLGVKGFGRILSKIGIEDANNAAGRINALTHKATYYFQAEIMNTNDEELFKEIFRQLKEKYQFEFHADQT